MRRLRSGRWSGRTARPPAGARSDGLRLRCGACDRALEPRPLARVCTGCGGPLLVEYDLEPGSGPPLAAAWRGRPAGAWRYAELLPLRPGESPVTLGEGGTPLLPLARPGRELGLDLRVKDESRNPTGSFKDRGLSAAVTRASLDGARRLVVPSAGNAGVALAAYAARAGLRARVYLPEDTPAAVVRRCAVHGAEVERVPGHIGECAQRAAAHARETGAHEVSTLREPYRVEGKKTMMLEIAEALDWQAPHAIVYPTGGGTGLIGAWKALRELAELGLTEAATRLYAVQAAGCAPVVRAFERGDEAVEPWEDALTTAWGLRVPSPFGGRLVLRALRESGGAAVAVEDASMEAAAAELRREGVPAGIEGGATLAGARALAARGLLRRGETVVLFNTGHVRNY